MARTKQTARRSTGARAPTKAQAYAAVFGVPRHVAAGDDADDDDDDDDEEQMDAALDEAADELAGAALNVRDGGEADWLRGEGDDEAFVCNVESGAAAEASPEFAAISDFYREARADEGLWYDVWQRDQEHRRAFAARLSTDRPPAIPLIDVFSEPDRFVFRGRPASANNILFSEVAASTRAVGSPLVCASLAVFRRQFAALAGGILASPSFRWNNLCVAGGAVVAAMLPEAAFANAMRTRENPFFSSDVDLFVYGLSPIEATRRAYEVAALLARDLDAVVLRSRHAITIARQFPQRHVQIVLRIYSCPAEVVLGFDLDSVAVYYDGSTVFATERFEKSLCHALNVVDPSRQSPTYELRLQKYALRGFAVAVPGLSRVKLSPSAYGHSVLSATGLARLLILESGYVRSMMRLHDLHEVDTLNLKQRKSNVQRALNRETLDESLLMSGAAASDYSTEFVPFGPSWTPTRLARMLQSREIGFSLMRKPCPFVFALPAGEMYQIETAIDAVFDMSRHQYRKNLRSVPVLCQWRTINPSSQLTASFYPMFDRDWYGTAGFIDGVHTQPPADALSMMAPKAPAAAGAPGMPMPALPRASAPSMPGSARLPGQPRAIQPMPAQAWGLSPTAAAPKLTPVSASSSNTPRDALSTLSSDSSQSAHAVVAKQLLHSSSNVATPHFAENTSVVLLGAIGSGKSALVNQLASILDESSAGEAAFLAFSGIADADESFTESVARFTVAPNLQVWDTPGLPSSPDEAEEAINAYLGGRFGEGVPPSSSKFVAPDTPVNVSTCAVCVAADALAEQAPLAARIYRLASRIGLRSVIVLTRCELIDAGLVSGTPLETSLLVRAACVDLIQRTGIPAACVAPIWSDADAAMPTLRLGGMIRRFARV